MIENQTSTLAQTIERARADRIATGQAWVRENGSTAADELAKRVEHRFRIGEILDATSGLRGRVVELGCFTGIVAERIMEQGGKEVVGVDVLDEALAFASQRGISTVHADVDGEIAALESESFDAVVAADVLQSLLAPEELVKESWRILAPEGTLIVSVPNFSVAANRILVALGKTPERCDLRGLNGIHPTCFTTATLTEMLEQQGFHVESARGDVVMFFGDWRAGSQLMRSRSLARAFPRLARNIIMVARKG